MGYVISRLWQGNIQWAFVKKQEILGRLAFFCILAEFSVAILCNLSDDKMLRRLKFCFACDDNSVLLPNILLTKKLCKISTLLSPKNFTKPQKKLDFSVLVWYDA
jgi:hypothetical protein